MSIDDITGDDFSDVFGGGSDDMQEEVVETPSASEGMNISEDSPLPPQDENSDDENSDENSDDDTEDEEKAGEVSVRLVFPNRKNPNPADAKKFLIRLEVPVDHDDAIQASKRVSSLTRARLKELREAVKTSDQYKAASEADQKAMLSVVKVKPGAALAEFFGISSLTERIQKFVKDAQDMVFETTAPERTRLSVKKAVEQARVAYLGMITAYVQMGVPAQLLGAKIVRFVPDLKNPAVHQILFSALVTEAEKSEEEAIAYVNEFLVTQELEPNFVPEKEEEETPSA